MRRFVVLLVLILAAPSLAIAQVDTVPPLPVPPGGPAVPAVDQEGVETLTRGPIHEAYANPAEPDPEPSPVVPQRPPADVPEQPPEYEPEGGDFDWFSGYWDWDDDRDAYLWVTGVWRQAPPGMRWVSGYWNDVEGGWQRVKGFWVSDAVDNVTYYQQPPASIEVGPSSPAPANNYFWIPGCWTYANTGFVWQGGYWAPYQPNWVWTPARWVWTPAGFVFLPGHWDYRLANRGQIFAPVYFRTTVYSNPGWFYRPTVVIPTNNLFIYLWVRPSYGCYYYGNYFGPQYVNRGFVAWANLPSYGHRHYYDPFYSYARVHYRQQGVDFVGRVQGWHKYYDEHPDHRPPRSWHEQEQWLASHRSGGATANTQLVAHHIADTNRQGDSAVRVKRIDAQTLEAQTQHAKKLRDFDATRRTVEREHALVSTTRTPPPGDQTRSRDQGKTSSLVDRAEKGDRTEKGDRADKGEKGRSTGQAVVASSTAAKLTLPKPDGPRSLSTTTRTPEGQQRGSADRGTKAPPLPTATRSSVATEGRSPNTPRPNPLEGAGRPSERAAGGQNATGQKSGDASRLPGRLDEPKITTGEPGRSITGELGNKAGPAKVRSDAGTVTGDTSRRSSDGPPRGEQKPRPNNLPQVLPPGRSSELPSVTPPSSANDVPRVQPPRPSADLPRVQSSGKSGDSPAIVVPGRNESPRNSGQGNQGKVNPGKTSSAPVPLPRSGGQPPGIETPRNSPRGDQPASRGVAPRTDVGAATPGSSARPGGREERRENTPPPSNSNTKGKGKPRPSDQD